MPLTLKQFVENVSQSGLMEAGEVNSFCENLPPERRDSVQDLAKLLVRERKLTKYQAQIIYQGKHQGLKFGEYTILDKLGEGGMGVVLRARHGRMEREVAIKVLPAKSLTNQQAIDRFYREVRAAAKLIHPNIVTAFDASEHAGSHYLVLEFVDGKDLSQILSESGRLPVAQAIECTIQAARGLEYAHSKGLIHRDIKPANLLLDKDGTVKILDLGLARLEQENASRDGLTKSGQIMGTVDYMSPEQARDTKTADARADIYSLGCTLYRLLTGMPLYDRDTIMNKMMSHASDPIPSLKAVRAEIPERLDAVFQKMVAKRADDRQQSMTEVIADLSMAIASTSLPEQRVTGQNSDSALTNFFAGLNSNSGVATTPATHIDARVVEETIDLHANSEGTAPNIPQQPLVAPSRPVRPKRVAPKRPATESAGKRKWLLWCAIGGGALCVALLLGVMKMMVGSGADSLTSVASTDATVADVDPRPKLFDFPEPVVLTPGPWYDLLPLVSSTDAAIGSWNVSSRGLTTTEPFRDATIRIPVIPQGSYRVHTSFTRNSGEHSVNFSFPVKDRMFGVWLDAGGGVSSLQAGNGQQGDRTRVRVDPDHLQSGYRYDVIVDVQLQDSDVKIDFELNGVSHLSWSGPQAALAKNTLLGAFSLGSYEGDTDFHELQLKVLTAAASVNPASGKDPAELIVDDSIVTQGVGERLLFNGRDLIGWQPVGDSDLWVVKGGILSATGHGTGWLSTEQEFSDFALRLEFRLPAEGNSGVFLRVPRSGGLSGSEFVEVQIYDGPPLNNGNHTGSLFNIAKLGPSTAQRPAGEWNSMEIVARKSRITVSLNGQQLQDVDLSDVTIPGQMVTNAARSTGFIGLQCLGTMAEFKDIRIRPL